jgi:NAD(P)-dependent dehydrogenase (short-subunit alcohol dehydrogenase family)
VNNAGISYESKNPPRRCHDAPDEAWDVTMAVNARSVWLGCKHVVGQMLKQEPHESGDRGWIVNLSSIFGLVGTALARELKVPVGEEG